MRLAPLGFHYGLVHEALKIGEHRLALRLAAPLLRAGDASMQWYFGLMHHKGIGVRKDWAEARRLYEESAAQGFHWGKDALLILSASENGTDVDSDVDPAILSAYSKIWSLTVPTEDTDTVVREVQRSAVLGDIEMQIALGICYEIGVHVWPEWKFALEWYRRAGAWGSRVGLDRYKDLSWSKRRHRGRPERCELEFVCEMASKTILKGPEPANAIDAFSWYHEAAVKGDSYACWRLCEFYMIGYGVEQCYDSSAEWGVDVLRKEASDAAFVFNDVYLEDLSSHYAAILTHRAKMRAAMAVPYSSVSPISSDS